MMKNRQPLFSLGQLSTTPAALALFENDRSKALPYLTQHQRGDWGDLKDSDREANDLALEQGDRLFSSYNLEGGSKIWIITEWDRSLTTILLPSDY